jgi:hypothetical protein
MYIMHMGYTIVMCVPDITYVTRLRCMINVI